MWALVKKGFEENRLERRGKQTTVNFQRSIAEDAHKRAHKCW